MSVKLLFLDIDGVMHSEMEASGPQPLINTH